MTLEDLKIDLDAMGYRLAADLIEAQAREIEAWRKFDSDVDDSSWPDAWNNHRDSLYCVQTATDAAMKRLEET